MPKLGLKGRSKKATPPKVPTAPSSGGVSGGGNKATSGDGSSSGLQRSNAKKSAPPPPPPKPITVGEAHKAGKGRYTENVNNAKKKEGEEQQRLKAERARGKAEREELKKKVVDKSTGPGKTSAYANDLRHSFDKALAEEEALRKAKISGGMDVDQAEDEAYREIWLQKYPELRAVRPMRETRSEKLVSKTGAMRHERSTAKSAKEAIEGRRGELLSKQVEDLFIKEIHERAAMMKADPNADPAKVAQQAKDKVWANVNPKIAAKRPAPGSKLEAAGYKLAEERAKLPTFEAGDKDLSKIDTAGTIGGYAMTATNKIGSLVSKVHDDDNDDTLSTGEKVGGGLSNLSDAVTGVFDTIVAIKDAYSTMKEISSRKPVDYNDVVAGISSIITVLEGLQSTASGATNAAAALDEGVLSKLGDNLPIVDIVSNSLSLANGIVKLVPTSVRCAVGTRDVFSSRAMERPELTLVFQRVGQRNSQLLAQGIYNVASNATKLAASIVTLVSGTTAAPVTETLKKIVTVADILNKIGHMIADDVFALQAQQARKSLIGRKEGSAEELLRRDASWAIDALLTAATQGDDTTKEVARASLKDSYGVVITTGSPAELTAAHERIMTLLSESDDPKWTLDKIKDAVKKIKSIGQGWADQSVDVKALAEARTAQDGKKRDWRWNMKMWFKSKGAIARRMAQHNEEHDTKLKTASEKRLSKYESQLDSEKGDSNISGPKVEDRLLKEIEKMTSKECAEAAKNPYRPQFDRIVLSQAAKTKLAEEQNLARKPGFKRAKGARK